MKRNTLFVGLLRADGAEVSWGGYCRARIEVPTRGEWSNEKEVWFSRVDRGLFVIDGFGLFASGALREDPILAGELTTRLYLSPGMSPEFLRGSLTLCSNVLWMIDTYLMSFPRVSLGGGPG